MLFNTYPPWKFAFSQETSNLEEVKKSEKNIWGIIGVPFDSTSSYHSGSRFGPIVIREASYNLEKYNSTFDCDLDLSFHDFGDLEVVHGNARRTCENLEIAISDLLSKKIKPLILGGEHSISLAPIKAIAIEQDIQDTTIIHLDAHMDMINEYQGEKFSHATVMRRIHDLKPKKIIQIGIRSGSEEEMEFVKKQDNIEVFSSKNVQNSFSSLEKSLIAIDGPIYLSLDMDVFDPSYVPSVGNPIPSGLSPMDMEEILRIITKKNVLGFDLVEIATDRLGDISAVTAAKIVHDFLSLINKN